jgi:hypothetical protein
MIRGRYQMWTTGQQKRLAELWRQPELSIEAIAFAMRRSQSSVQRMAKSLGLPSRHVLRAARRAGLEALV